MAQPEIKYAIHKSAETGRFLLGFDNLTKAEAAEYLLLLARQQEARGDPVVDDGAAFKAAAPRDPMAERLARCARFVRLDGDAEGIMLHGEPAGEGRIGGPLLRLKAVDVISGPRFVTKPAHFDHKYEPGAFGVCKRCGGEKH